MRINHRVMAAALCAAAAVPSSTEAQDLRPSPIPEPELLRRIAHSTDSLARLGEFSGVVLLARNGQPVFQRALGMADRESGRPNTIETAFNIGSINKVFTATAIRQLAAQGRLHVDSTLGAYWPDYPNPDVRRVTIRQLLSHRSGIGGNVFGAPPGGTRQSLRHNNDYFPLFAARPLDFEPGTQQRYSNAGFVVLGMLVERLSGQDYYDYVRQHIYEPAGMRQTAHWASDSLPAAAAIGYTRDSATSSSWRRNTESLPGRGSAAGGGYSTAQDLMRFVQALREGRIAAGPPPGMGAAGGAPGINALVLGALPGGYDLVVLSSQDPPTAERLGRLVRGWLGADS